MKIFFAKPLRIRLDKVHAFIRVYDWTRYLVLLDFGKNHDIFHRIRYLLVVKSGIAYAFSHNYARIKVDSYDSLSLKKWLTLLNCIILIKSIFNKDRNYYCYIAFL